MINNDNVEILLVEDNPYEVELIQRALQKGRIDNPLKIITNGADAVSYFFGSEGLGSQQNSIYPRVIILDLKLPKLDGLEVLRLLKDDPRTRAIPVVVLTASAEEKDIQECYRLGANSYIVKPVDFDLFLEMIAHLGHYWLEFNHPSP